MEWIEVSKEFPKCNKEVLVKCKHPIKHYGIAKYQDGNWWEYYSLDDIKGWAAFEGIITHWAKIED